jgi:putative phosphoesterase
MVAAMRIAVVSDIHGNLSALEAVVADLRVTSPDLVLQGGDVAVIGARPAEVTDRVRELRWPSVLGNTDAWHGSAEARAAEERLVPRMPKLQAWLATLFEVLLPWAAERLGEERLDWLRTRPMRWRESGVSLVHASPHDLWRAPLPDAADDELAATYGEERPGLVVYGHIHRPYVRPLPDGLTVANAGSAGLPWDGDPRAAYLLVDDGQASVRRVAYDTEREARALTASGFPLASWLAGVHRAARYERP